MEFQREVDSDGYYPIEYGVYNSIGRTKWDIKKYGESGFGRRLDDVINVPVIRIKYVKTDFSDMVRRMHYRSITNKELREFTNDFDKKFLGSPSANKKECGVTLVYFPETIGVLDKVDPKEYN